MKSKNLSKLKINAGSEATNAEGDLNNHHVRNQLKTKSKLLQNTISKLRNSIINKHKKLITNRTAYERELEHTFKPIIKPIEELKTSFDNRNKNNKQIIENIGQNNYGERNEVAEISSAVDDDKSYPQNNLQKLTQQYVTEFLVKKKNVSFGLSFDKKTNQFKFGANSVVRFDNKHLYVDAIKYPLSHGLLELIFRNKPNADLYGVSSIRQYKRILMQTHIHLNKHNNLKTNSGFKYKNVIKKIFPSIKLSVSKHNSSSSYRRKGRSVHNSRQQTHVSNAGKDKEEVRADVMHDLIGQQQLHRSSTPLIEREKKQSRKSQGETSLSNLSSSIGDLHRHMKEAGGQSKEKNDRLNPTASSSNVLNKSFFRNPSDNVRLSRHNESTEDDDDDDDDNYDSDDYNEVRGKGIGKIKSKLNMVRANKKSNCRNYVYFDNADELVERLALLIGSQSAGHDNHSAEITSIISELVEAGIIEIQ